MIPPVVASERGTAQTADVARRQRDLAHHALEQGAGDGALAEAVLLGDVVHDLFVDGEPYEVDVLGDFGEEPRFAGPDPYDGVKLGESMDTTTIDILYCPMCGRPLGGNEDDD